MAPPNASADRRQTVRVPVEGVLYGKFVASGVPFAVRDLSEGGCAVESTHAFVTGERHRLTLSGPQGRVVNVEAALTHCMRMTVETGETRYLLGFAFVSTEAARNDIARMLADLAVPQ